MNSFDKQTIRQWLYEIDKVKAENKRFEELLTKWKDKRIEVLIKENRELRKENKELKENFRYYKTKSEFLNKVVVEYQEENKELKWELNLLTNQK